ncbi:MAG: hypothetical protein KTR31_34630 [Myxococcales bacterium]|nr:hypothetical protein [Myxococcales bacterium]
MIVWWLSMVALAQGLDPVGPDAAVASTAPVARAPMGADLAGTWRLDKSASEAMDEILLAMGANWFERQILKTSTPNHEIVPSEDMFTVIVRSGPYKRVDEMPLDNVERSVDYAIVGTAHVRGRMEGDAVWTGARLTFRDGTEGMLESTRRRKDADTMLLVMRLTKADGTVLEANRIFRRVR